MTDADTIANRLRVARDARGLSQAELAERCGLQPSAISHYETGRREPSAANLARLCRALEVSADAILDLPSHGDNADELRRLRRFVAAVVKAQKALDKQ